MRADHAPGLSQRLPKYLSQHGLPLSDEQEFHLLAGGKSNITYRFTTANGEYVLRRPPLGQAMATAHDMGREFRVLSALQSTEVPVPTTYHLCTSEEVIGAPFYVMQYVDGATFRSREDLAAIGPERTRQVSESMVDTLVKVHAVEPSAVGLQDFGHPAGFTERQVHRWMAQLDRSRTRDIDGLSELHRVLAAGAPASTSSGIVHGDFRLDNLLINSDYSVAATVDWELSTLGAQLTDLGMLLVYQLVAEMDLPYKGADASRAPGYLTGEQIVERYVSQCGADVRDLGFFLAFGYFKLAAIREGIHYRHVNGQTVGPGFDEVGETVPRLVAEGLEAARYLPTR